MGKISHGISPGARTVSHHPSRAHLRTFSLQDADQVAQAVEFQADLEAELRKVCGELLELVDRKGEEMDGAVFFQKMAGDYHRYMAEIEAGKEKGGNPEHARNALDAYTRAYDLVRPDR